jgi:hypothetical protein
MTARPSRFTGSPSTGPALHELPPLRVFDQLITLLLSVRRDDHGAWRARLHFIDAEARERETAEIFCGASEPELWQSVRGLHDHHLRALYLSLA